VESAELIAILREVRDRVRAQHPENGAPGEIPVPDLLPLLHARDAALGKVAAIGTVNPRRGGPINSLVQAWKRLLARVLDWHVREQIVFNRQLVECVDAALQALDDSNRTLRDLAGRIAAGGAHAAALQRSQEALAIAQRHVADELQATHRRLRDELAGARNGLREELEAVERQLEERIGNRQSEFDSFRSDHRQLETEFHDIRKHWAEWRQGWEHKLAVNEIQFLRSVADLQGAFQHRVTLMDTSYRESVRTQHAEFTVALEKAAAQVRMEAERVIHTELRLVRQRLAAGPAGEAPTAPPRSETPSLGFDYGRFAERFRGSEEYVRANQKIYLPDFSGCRNVLDIGCGRGEFLEMMREAGIRARGIDSSSESVALCREKGLEAEIADLFEYLSSQPEALLDGIFCSQVVEHLPPASLPEMIRLAASRLGPNGVIAIETPNPECLAIFATHFYLDPTHTRPVPHPLLTFYLEEFGVGGITVRKLSPAVETMPALAELPAEFRDTFFGGLDYAVVGRKL